MSCHNSQWDVGYHASLSCSGADLLRLMHNSPEINFENTAQKLMSGDACIAEGSPVFTHGCDLLRFID